MQCEVCHLTIPSVHEAHLLCMNTCEPYRVLCSYKCCFAVFSRIQTHVLRGKYDREVLCANCGVDCMEKRSMVMAKGKWHETAYAFPACCVDNCARCITAQFHKDPSEDK